MCCWSEGARIDANVASEVSSDQGLCGSLPARTSAEAGPRSSLSTAWRITGSTAVRNVVHARTAAASGALAVSSPDVGDADGGGLDSVGGGATVVGAEVGRADAAGWVGTTGAGSSTVAAA